MGKLLPTVYDLELYEGRLDGDPSFSMQSSTPFLNFSVGDYFNHQMHRGWHSPPKTWEEKFVVDFVEHILFSDEKNNVHKIMVVLKKVPVIS